MFGDLPDEWGDACPSLRTIGTLILASRSILSCDIRDAAIAAGITYQRVRKLRKGWFLRSDDPEFDRVTLKDWLQETYFEDDKKPYFSGSDIDALGTLLESVLQYRPPDRPRASDLLSHSWFQRKPCSA